jgi:glutaminyl-peptide cyclotransferase
VAEPGNATSPRRRTARRSLPGLLAVLVAMACGASSTPDTAPTTPGTDLAPPTAPPLTTAPPTTAPPTTAPVHPSPVEPRSLDDVLTGPDVVRLVPQVVATVPHDPTAFTQGLEEYEGVLLESTGQYGESDRRRVDLVTGEVLSRVPLPSDHFGEGLTVADGRLYQLTWQEGLAHVADPETLEPLGEPLAYTGEGWGLCFDGEHLVMSDGSDRLRLRDPSTFELLWDVPVTRDGEPVPFLNELDCGRGLVWANVWLTTDIVAIDLDTGQVRAVVDASALVPDGVGDDAILNGIARRPDGDTFWLTGKYWPVLYEVRLVPAG